MNESRTFRSEEQLVLAVDALAALAVGLSWDDLPVAVRDRVQLMLTDLFGVAVAGARTPEIQSLAGAWASPAGAARIPGTALRTSAETAAYLSAAAACMLELDEGNKYAAGHPAGHVVFAAVAAAAVSGRAVSGERFLTAVAAGYEVAARFGRATRRDPRWHPHGNWGATGAACAAALLLDEEPDAGQVAAAIDASCGLMHVTPWETVLSGDFTRNLWMAGANQAGLNAARLARAGLVRNRGSARNSLGDIVGTLDPTLLVDDLGSWWLAGEGYLKLHSSCSYTHGAVDLVQQLQLAGAWTDPREVAAVQVRVHSLAAPLLRRHPENRLAAMFSLPFVVSTAMVNQRVEPDVMAPGTPEFAATEEFSARVDVIVDEHLDAYLPERRCTEVAVTLVDGSTMAVAQSNPIGDVGQLPLGPDEVATKLHRLVGPADAQQVVATVAALAGCPSVTALLDQLP